MQIGLKKHVYRFNVIGSDSREVEVLGNNIREAMTALYEEVLPTDMAISYKRTEAKLQIVKTI